MSGAAAGPGARAAHAPAAPRERGWGRTLLALAAVLLLGALPAWPPALQSLAALVRALVPVPEVVTLVAPALAACTLVGWWAGGPLAPAVGWGAVAVWMVVLPAAVRASDYATLARGWAMLLAAAFGLASVIGGLARPFFARALLAVAFAFVAGTTALVVAGRRPAEVTRVAGAEYPRRVDRSLAVWRRHAGGPAWTRGAGAGLAARAEGAADAIAALPTRTAAALPALLGLESLAVLALAWALYHRLARVRIGPPLSRLADFRFNDQLAWGVVAGATMALLPALEEFRPLGINVLLFFGALYALRGLGVLRWWADTWLVGVGAAGVALAAVVLVPVAGVVLPAALVGAAALALGFGDTVAGWRVRGRAGAP